jgi:hypothetical protein
MPKIGILIDGKIISTFNGAIVKNKATGKYQLRDGRPVEPYNKKDSIIKYIYIPKK